MINNDIILLETVLFAGEVLPSGYYQVEKKFKYISRLETVSKANADFYISRATLLGVYENGKYLVPNFTKDDKPLELQEVFNKQLNLDKIQSHSAISSNGYNYVFGGGKWGVLDRYWYKTAGLVTNEDLEPCGDAGLMCNRSFNLFGSVYNGFVGKSSKEVVENLEFGDILQDNGVLYCFTDLDIVKDFVFGDDSVICNLYCLPSTICFIRNKREIIISPGSRFRFIKKNRNMYYFLYCGLDGWNDEIFNNGDNPQWM